VEAITGELDRGLSFQATKEAAKAEASLYEFSKAAWRIVEPIVEFIPNWHIEAICAHLEASFYGGKIGDMMINVPPGAMKSLICSVFFPSWAWITNPATRMLFASYEIPMALKASDQTRKIIESEWYQERWGHLFHFTDREKTKTRFENSEGGWRLSTSPGGRGMGEHPDIIICDDPHKGGVGNLVGESRAERLAVLEWWKGTISTRGVSRGVRKLVIMQRLHVQDLCGDILDGDTADEYTHICIPMRYEPGRMATTGLGWNDPRTTPGELLWPELFNETRVRKMERILGTIRAAGQLQQRPMPAGGGMFQRSWFPVIDYDKLQFQG
jgi:hypothetical protein